MSRVRGQTYVTPLHCFILWCARTSAGSRYRSFYEPTEPSQPMMSDDVNDEDRPQHREQPPLLFSNSVWVL